MTTLLAGDIGGTKTLLALYELDACTGLTLLRSERFPSADWEDLAPMVRHFLGHGGPSPSAACLAVAGPVAGGQATLTNLDWQLDQGRLQQSTGIPRIELVNDFAVLIYGLPHLAPEQQAPIRSGIGQADAPLLILGAGTGLGVAYGVPSQGGLVAVASEGAHGEFAPRSSAEWELKQWLARERGLERVSIERVVSGTGLGEVARWLLHIRHPNGDHPLSAHAKGDDLPAAVAAAATQGETLARDALSLWIGCYGSVCGDLALAGLSRGGIWLAGGTAGKLLEDLRSPGFEQAFLNKGRLEPVLAAMPITAVIDPAIGQFSAACRARMLVA
jgi:glucokinase